MKESTNQLIERLATGLPPSPRHALSREFVTAAAIGGTTALLMLVASLGLRPDLATATGQWMLWTKLGYAAVLAAGGYLLCVEAARPDARPGWRIALVLFPVALAAAAALVRITALPQEARSAEWLGETAALCPWLIGLLSLPCLLALLAVMRRAAPTRLRWAGLCAGLLAGAVSMLMYSLHCPEQGVAFVATWYTLGMCVPAAIGALLGPQLLRW
jgi:hypothetical protein